LPTQIFQPTESAKARTWDAEGGVMGSFEQFRALCQWKRKIGQELGATEQEM
jgi:hypothetical protein